MIVVGGGVVGLSVAYHLAARGYPEVVLVERRALGSGATSKGTGAVRQLFSSEINIALSRRAVDYFSAFEERVGEPSGFRQHGYLFLLDRPAHLDAFKAATLKQRAAGVPSELLEPGEIREVMPFVDVAGLVGASYCPTDGSASSKEVALIFARRARALGVRLLEGVSVIAIERDAHGAVSGVRTTAGFMPAEAVVNASGAWAAEVGRLVEVDLPIKPYRRQAFEIAQPGWLKPELPVTVDLGSGAYMHPKPQGSVIGGNDRGVGPGFDQRVDEDLVPSLLAALRRRIPAMSDAEIRSGWAGLRDMTPDDHAIVGPIAEVPGFWIAAGFSGHGFMHSPVTGELLSQWLLDGNPDMDLSRLSLERFEGEAVILEQAVF